MKIHLDIRNDVPPTIALECVKQVIGQGKISNGGKSYCYATIFNTSDGEVWVKTIPYRKSDCFLVFKNKERMIGEPLTKERVLERYEEIVNETYKDRCFTRYYVTDNQNNKEHPYTIKHLWGTFLMRKKNTNKQLFEFSEEQKKELKEKLLEAFEKENIYTI